MSDEVVVFQIMNLGGDQPARQTVFPHGSEGRIVDHSPHTLLEVFAEPYIIGYLKCQYIDRPVGFSRDSRQGFLRGDGSDRKTIIEAYATSCTDTHWPLNGEQDNANWIEGVIATRIRDCTIAVTEPSITDQPLICGKYWPNNIRYYEDWLANQLQAEGNIYWDAATEKTFDAAKARGEQTNYSTLSEWQQATGQDGDSVWRKPDGSYPLPAKAEVVGEDIPVHRQ